MIGCGKESDVYICASPSNRQLIMKIHRLGRISFRSIKTNRDYLRHRSSASWMYMSRLAALKEWTFMNALWREGFAVPEPVAWSRHTVVMAVVEGCPLRQVRRVGNVSGLYAELMEIIMKLGGAGLIHGDFNEFNIMIVEEEVPAAEKGLGGEEEGVKVKPVVIDFPQMVSIDHENAEMYFNRDVNCIKRFFERRFHFTSDEPGPFFKDVKELAGGSGSKRLDVEVEASGFSKKMARELEKYMKAMGVDGDGSHAELDGSDAEDSDDVEDSGDQPEESSTVIPEKAMKEASLNVPDPLQHNIPNMSLESGQ